MDILRVLASKLPTGNGPQFFDPFSPDHPVYTQLKKRLLEGSINGRTTVQAEFANDLLCLLMHNYIDMCSPINETHFKEFLAPAIRYCSRHNANCIKL